MARTLFAAGLAVALGLGLIWHFRIHGCHDRGGAWDPTTQRCEAR